MAKYHVTLQYKSRSQHMMKHGSFFDVSTPEEAAVLFIRENHGKGNTQENSEVASIFGATNVSELDMAIVVNQDDNLPLMQRFKTIKVSDLDLFDI